MINTIEGTYGSNQTPCDIFTYSTNRGTWYAVEGSAIVNFTYDEISDGCDVEMLCDADVFTWSDPIESEIELEEAVNF